MLNDLEKAVLSELLKNAKTSDRNIAKKLNVSQATITRARKKLESQGYIKRYTVIPSFGKLECEIVAFTFVKMNPQIYSNKAEEVKNYAHKWPNAIYVSRGEGLGMTGIIISLHKNYTDYMQKLNTFRRDWGQYIEDLQSFITTVSEGIIKEFSLEYITECLKQ